MSNVDYLLDNASSFRIVIQSNLTEIIKNLNNQYPSGQIPKDKEIELRYGKIDLYKFQTLQHILDQISTQNYVEYSKVEAYKDFRVITYFTDSAFTSKSSTIYERKRLIVKEDIASKPYPLRIAHSSETILSGPIASSEPPSYKKTQTRFVYDFDKFQVHLSKILSDSKESYEMEIEIKNINKLLSIIKFGFVLMNESISILDDGIKSSLKNNYKQLLTSYPDIKQINDMFDNKPISIGYNNINLLTNDFIVTNKLDGTHFNLVFSQNDIYLINSTDIILIYHGSDSWNKLQKQKTYVLDGELVFDPKSFKFYLYIFDSLIIDGVDVATTKTHKERVNITSFIQDFSSMKLNNIFQIKLKHFFYKKNIYKDTYDCIEYIKNIYGDDYLEKDDGLIFISSTENYNAPIYKWKFPERITIDGKIKLYKKENRGNIYSFLFKKGREYVPLRDKGELQLFVPLTSNFYSILRDDMIVEGKFENNTFIPTRIRTDKNEPNAIKTAVTTYHQIKTPMNEKQLLESLTKDKEIIAPKPTTTTTIVATKSLEMLKVDKVKPFKANFSNIPFIRIGTIAEGSCLIHSILLLLYPINYSEMDEAKRKKFAKQIRKDMADTLTIDIWSSLGNESISVVNVEIEMNENMNEKDSMEFNKYMASYKGKSFNEFIKYLKSKYNDVDKYVAKAYNRFKSKLDSCEFFDISMFEYASMYFDVNLIIIRDNTKDVERALLDIYNPDKRSIFILNIANIHFETLISITDGALKFDFEDSDEVIKEMKAYYYKKPEIVIEVIQEKLSEIDKKNISKEVEEIFNKYFIFDKSKQIDLSIE